MTGEIAVNSQSDSDIGKLLGTLHPSEISQIFTDLCCPDCQSALRSRLLSFVQQKELSKLDEQQRSPSNSSPSSPHNAGVIGSSSSSRSWGSGYGHPLRQNVVQGSPSSSPTVSPEDSRELARISQVGRKKNLVYYEKVGGKKVNVLQGLELHTGVFNAQEQDSIVNFVEKLQDMGRKGQLRDRTYSEPKKWMRGKGRVTLQFGCCYNYAVDKDGNPPGIIRDEEVDPLPSVFKDMIKRLVKWRVLPATCVPDSCIVNIYDEGDCIPPHIDHHDFLRPFCTVSFLTEANILFGSNLKILGPGEFSGPFSLPLPVGSVLVLSGNGADVAKHCVPGVPGKRISVTFRKMDDGKVPYSFSPDQELLNIRSPLQIQSQSQTFLSSSNSAKNNVKASNSFSMTKDDFPPLGA